MGALLGRVHAPDPDPKNTGDHRERKRRRGWGLSVSTAFLRRSSYKEPERQETGRNEEAIRDIAGYLRNNVETGHRSFAYPVPTSVPSSLYSSEDRIEQSPDMCTSFYSSEDEENEDEITTPPDDTMSELQQTQSYPKYYNFDELMKSGGAYAGDILVAAEGADVRPLEYLREQVAREVKWRDEIVDELGYLGSVVV